MPIKQKQTGLGVKVEISNALVGTVANGLTAAGTNQATAYTLSLDDNHIFTTVAAGTGAIIPAASYAPGDTIRISNYGANALLVYPASGGAIANGTTNAAISITANSEAILTSIDGLNFTAINASGTPSGTGTVTNFSYTNGANITGVVTNPSTTPNLTTNLTTTGVSPGSYTNSNLTVDIYGRISAIASGSSGGVTSVGLSLPAEFTVSGSPVTTSGTLTGAWANESANKVFAGPATGSPATPTFRALVAADLPLITSAIIFHADGGGAVISTGVKEYVQIPFACTITQNTLLGDASGSMVINIYKCTYSQFDAGATHPVVGDKITASAPPTITAATKSQDSTLTGWTVAIAANDILAFVVDSCSTITKADLTLKITK